MEDLNKVALPDYLTKNADGTFDVKLRSAITINGAKVTALRMREPTVGDHLVQKAVKGDDDVKEMTMVANLCSLSLDDVKQLGLHDYKRAQECFVNFIG